MDSMKVVYSYTEPDKSVVWLDASTNETKVYIDNTWQPFGDGGGDVESSVDNALSSTSTNPVQNKVVTDALDGKLDKTGGTISGDEGIILKDSSGNTFASLYPSDEGVSLTNEMVDSEISLLNDGVAYIRGQNIELEAGVSATLNGKAIATTDQIPTKTSELTNDSDFTTTEYIDTLVNSTEFKASIKGDKGDKGDTGAQGAQGVQGEKGDKGDSGVSLGEIAIVQTTGSSEESVMSQKAVTDDLLKRTVYGAAAPISPNWVEGCYVFYNWDTPSDGRNGTLSESSVFRYADISITDGARYVINIASGGGAIVCPVSLWKDGEFVKPMLSGSDDVQQVTIIGDSSFDVIRVCLYVAFMSSFSATEAEQGSTQSVLDNMNDKIDALDDSLDSVPSVILPDVLKFRLGTQYAVYKNMISDLAVEQMPSFDVAYTTAKDYGRFLLIENLAGETRIGFRPTQTNLGKMVSPEKMPTTFLMKKVVVPTDYNGKSVNVLAIGDSFTEIGQWLAGIKEHATSDGVTINWVGTMPVHADSAIKSENQTGGNLSCFMNSRETLTDLMKYGSTYRVDVTGIGKRNMDVFWGSYVTYTCNGTTWRVNGYQLDDAGDGYLILTDEARETGSLLSSGTLILAGGIGDSSISYTDAIEVDGNPFWNPTTSSIDFAWYLSTFNLDTPDIFLIQLTANEVLTYYDGLDSRIKAFVDNLNSFIAAIHAQLPSAKVIFSIEPVGATAIPLVNLNSPKYIRTRIAQSLYDIYNGSDYVSIVPSYLFVDGEFGITRKAVKVLDRFDDTINVPYGNVGAAVDNIHPNEGGMKQISDIVYPYILDYIS